VVNRDYVSANSALTKAGFAVKIIYMQHPASADNGLVVQQDPQGGVPLEKGSTVNISLSVPGEVPDTEGMDLQSAENTLLNNGYTLGNITPTTEGADGKVVRTEPEAGTKLNPGTPVNIYINSASAQPPRR
jgi:serine/threonine-protein kinase